jgi:hypothetical protein
MKKKSTLQSAFFKLRVLLASVFCLTGVVVALVGSGAFSSVFAQVKGTNNNRSAQASPGTQTPDVVGMVGPVALNQDLRSLPYIPPKPGLRRVLTRYPLPGAGQTGAATTSGTSGLAYVQPLLQSLWRSAPTMPGPLLTFEGLDQSQDCCDFAVPDTDGDVGPNHYIEALNDGFNIFDKNGNTLSGPTTFNSFFSTLKGTPCEDDNSGDPFVFYDQIADRWVITDFAHPEIPGTSFFECIGVSQTGDPVAGGWNLYALQTDPAHLNQLGDYPKWAMWNDGAMQNAYFLTVNLYITEVTFVGVRAFALDRASMIAGGPANAIAFTIPPANSQDPYLPMEELFSLVPASFRAGDPPPAGRDEMLLAIDSPATGGVTLTQVHAWKFHVDFANPGNSTLGIGANHTPNAEITVNGFVDAFTNTLALVPQQGTRQKLDTLGDRIMTPLAYQNRSGTESLYASQTVILNYPSGPTAVRWYQFDVTGGTFPATPVQQQDWTNGNDGLWRWMPSIAVDANGNAAIGYSTSSTTIFPSIRYAGRLATDPIGNLGQGEAIMTTGGGSQLRENRWGDYTMTTIDPSDGHSFWHVNEYYPTTHQVWHTRIGKFRFPSRPEPTPRPHPSPTPHPSPP